MEPPSEGWDDTDVTEKPGKTYYFIGARYRGTIVPKFLLNMFVDEGGSLRAELSHQEAYGETGQVLAVLRQGLGAGCECSSEGEEDTIRSPHSSSSCEIT